MSTNTEINSQRRLASDPRMPKLGQVVCQRYRIMSVLGEGGFAVVYRANDDKLGGEVAFKVLEPAKSADDDFAQRFHQEINLVRQLKHHNTIKIWDAGLTDSGCLYMATELIVGQELSKLIAPGRGMAVDRVIRIVSQVLKSLAEAHKASIIHRDLKPSNIMVSQLEGEPDYVKVLDFGIAKALTPGLSMVETQTGMVMCTPSYASPEVLRGQTLSPASDIYSLGLIMIEMLTGQQAVQGDSLVDIMGQQISPTPIKMPVQLAAMPIGAVIARATAKKVEERYQSAIEMLTDLSGLSFAIPVTPAGLRTPSFLVTGDTLLAPGQSPSPSTGPQARRSRGPLAWIAVLLGLLVAVVVVIGAILLTRDRGDGDSAGTDTAQLNGKPTGPSTSGRPSGYPGSQLTPPGGLQVPPSGPVVPWTAGLTGQPGQMPTSPGWNTPQGQAVPVPPGTTGPGITFPLAGQQVPPVEGSLPLAGQQVPPVEGSLPLAGQQVPPVEGSLPPMAVPGSGPASVEGEPPLPQPGSQVNTADAVAPRPELPPLAENQVRASVLYRVPRGNRTLLILTGCGEESGLMEGHEGEIEGTSATARISLITSEQDCEAESDTAMNDLGTVTSVLFTVAPTEETPPAQVEAEGGAARVIRVEGTPRSVRLAWRYADDEEATWSDSTRCSRPCDLEIPAGGRPIEIRARKTDYCSETVRIDPAPGQTTAEITLRAGCSTSQGQTGFICANGCQWAFDGECDDGGPSSMYALCPLGSDCYDCGPRPLY